MKHNFLKSYTLPKLIQEGIENGSSLFFLILLGFENFKCSFGSYPSFPSLLPEQPAPSNFLAFFIIIILSCPQHRVGLHVHSSVLGVGLSWARVDLVHTITTAVHLSEQLSCRVWKTRFHCSHPKPLVLKLFRQPRPGEEEMCASCPVSAELAFSSP